ncbi:hypothetical protein, partial [Stieleria maiorica]|uniref:hypothetical protein n=1 Tax=Stieleria maiorica TaxID=2795974 RepID=UPI001F189749
MKLLHHFSDGAPHPARTIRETNAEVKSLIEPYSDLVLAGTTIAPKLGCKQEFFEKCGVPACDFSFPPKTLLPGVSLEKRRD